MRHATSAVTLLALALAWPAMSARAQGVPGGDPPSVGPSAFRRAPDSSPGSASLLDAVGNVGIVSADIPTADLHPLEAALDRAIVINAAAARGRTATLNSLAADPEISSRRAEARRAADAGANAMRSLDLDKAQAEFDKSLALFVASHAAWLDRGDLARLHTTRAKLALVRQNKARMREEFDRTVPAHPTKTLDPVAFPPDAVTLFDEALAAARKAPLAPPSAVPLADIARRTGLRWIVAAEVRARTAGYAMTLTVVDHAGQVESANVTIDESELTTTLDVAVAKLFSAAKIPPGSAESNLARIRDANRDPAPERRYPTGAESEPNSAPIPVPARALPSSRPTPKPVTTAPPWHRKWYVWAGAAIAAGATAALATSATRSKSSTNSGGITLVIERP